MVGLSTPGFSAEFFRLGRDGKPIYIQTSYNSILNDEGKILRVMNFASDITKQARARREALGVGHAVASGKSQLTTTAKV